MYGQPFIYPGQFTPLNGMANKGLLTKISSLIGGIKKVNWTNLINNTSKTLGIINQTIPMVKQVGPLVGNMKSMLKVAGAFSEITSPSPKNNTVKETNINQKQKIINENIETSSNYSYNTPKFFVNT